jgi:hypothetical protein
MYAGPFRLLRTNAHLPPSNAQVRLSAPGRRLAGMPSRRNAAGLPHFPPSRHAARAQCRGQPGATRPFARHPAVKPMVIRTPIVHVAFFGLLLTASAALAGSPVQEPAPSAVSRTFPPAITYRTSRAATPIRIDGVLDEEAWKHAAVIPLDWEWAPADNVPPPVRTDCLITYDGRNLYIAFKAYDPDPKQIRAHLMDRDDTDTLIQDDHVGITLDTFDDERRAFEFRVNPLGVQADAILSEQDGVEDFSWDMIWNSVARVTDEGYVVEMALPLKQLRFPPGGGPQTWGFEAFRSWPRNVRHRIASNPRDRNKGCILCQENKLAGFDGLSQGRNLEFDPTATFSRTDELQPGTGSLGAGSIDRQAGLTGRWNVTPNMTLNGTLNPDFSQVEADVAQLDVNTRFALYYPEKRPFFLEGVDFFTTPIQAVFTRTIADPSFGAKLTGKQGPSAVGVFVARDSINNLLFPSNQGSISTSLDQAVTTTVGRYRRDVGKNSTVGGLLTSREGADYHNRQFGVDAFFRPNPADAWRVQFVRSDTRYPASVAQTDGQPPGAFGGSALWVDYQHITRTWAWFGSFESYGPGFRSDTGFVSRVDYRSGQGQIRRRWWRGGGSWFNTIDVGVGGWRNTNSDWDLSEQTVAGFFNYTGPYQIQIQFNAPRDVVVYQGVRYEYPRPSFYFGIKPNGDSFLSFNAQFGGGVDFDNGRRAISSVQLQPAIDYRPTSSINLNLSYALDRLSVDGGRLYQANLAQLKVVYNLNVRTFVRAILQYTDITRDPALYTFPVAGRARHLFSQYLFSFKLNPQTVIFCGYSDNATSGVTNIDLQRQNRTFFVKLGYAWVL